MSPEQLRRRLGMSRGELARALGVSERTIARWEDGVAPQGLAAEVMRAIENALLDGAEPKHVAWVIGSGIGSLVHHVLVRPRLSANKKA